MNAFDCDPDGRLVEPAEIDFTVENHGSILLLRGLTPECEQWIDERVGGEDRQEWNGAIVVEPRYIGAIVEGLEAEGFRGQ